ncbi:MAG: GDYXXLXY domain-containing protein [Verrucomicrobiota bacterium]
MRRKLLVLVLVLQLAWLLGTVATQETALVRGQLIRLETQPVDPRDLLRGDYLVLNYKISNVPKALFTPPLAENLPPGEVVWIAVSPHGEFYEVVRASRERFEPAADQILIKAQTSWNNRRSDAEHLQYGLEQYFVHERTGNPRGKITVEAVVSTSGRASIKQVFLDGRPYSEAMKEQAQ